MSHEADVTVRERPGRFEILVDGALAGHTEYRDEGEQRIFPHTEIDPQHRGQGLASQLIRQALEATRATGRTVVPSCPAVAGFIAKNREFADLVPLDQQARLEQA